MHANSDSSPAGVGLLILLGKYDRKKHGGRCMQQLLRASEAAEFLNTSKAALYDLVRRRAIPFVRLSERRIRFSREALEKWVTTSSGQSDELYSERSDPRGEVRGPHYLIGDRIQ